MTKLYLNEKEIDILLNALTVQKELESLNESDKETAKILTLALKNLKKYR